MRQAHVYTNRPSVFTQVFPIPASAPILCVNSPFLGVFSVWVVWCELVKMVTLISQQGEGTDILLSGGIGHEVSDYWDPIIASSRKATPRLRPAYSQRQAPNRQIFRSGG